MLRSPKAYLAPLLETHRQDHSKAGPGQSVGWFVASDHHDLAVVNLSTAERTVMFGSPGGLMTELTEDDRPVRDPKRTLHDWSECRRYSFRSTRTSGVVYSSYIEAEVA